MHKLDYWIGSIAGGIGGFCKYNSLSQINITFSSKLIESLVIAALCALVGLLIKDIYVWVKRKIFK